MTGKVPYAEYVNDMGIYRAIDKKQPPARPIELSGPNERANQMWTLLRKCWDHDPVARPNASLVLTSVCVEYITDHPTFQAHKFYFSLVASFCHTNKLE